MTQTWPKTSQRQLWLLLESFLRSESHTVASALATLGIYALSQRCGQLSRMGWPVYSVWEPHDGGQHLRYCLPAEFLHKWRNQRDVMIYSVVNDQTHFNPSPDFGVSTL